MQPRRSKVVPGPLVYPEKTVDTAAAADDAAPVSADHDAPPAAKAAATTPTAAAASGGTKEEKGPSLRPRLFRVSSPATIQPSVTPMSAAEPFSPGLNVYRRGAGPGLTASISPKTTILVDHHVTNTGAVVRLEQVDYSKAMRAYRVCRQEGGVVAMAHAGLLAGAAGGISSSSSGSSGSSNGGTPSSTTGAAAGGVATPNTFHVKGSGNNSIGNAGGGPSAFAMSPNTSAGSGSASSSSGGSGNATAEATHRRAPWGVVLLRLFGAADMVLLAIAVACFVVVVSRLRVSQPVGRGSTAWASAGLSSSSSREGSSVGWVVSAMAGLVARSPALPSSEEHRNAEQAEGGAGGLVPAAAASYRQATRAASLDTMVTFALLFCSVLVLAYRLSSAFTRVYVEEVLVMRGVGLQFSAYGIFNTLRYKIFVDLQMLRSLVIHDAFFRYQPMFYLSSSVENRPERLVYFPDTLPRLAVLRPVLRGLRAVLYGEPEDGASLAELEERWKTASGDVSDGELFTEDSFAEDTVTTPDDGRSSDGTDHDEE